MGKDTARGQASIIQEDSPYKIPNYLILDFLTSRSMVNQLLFLFFKISYRLLLLCYGSPKKQDRHCLLI